MSGVSIVLLLLDLDTNPGLGAIGFHKQFAGVDNLHNDMTPSSN